MINSLVFSKLRGSITVQKVRQGHRSKISINCNSSKILKLEKKVRPLLNQRAGMDDDTEPTSVP